VARASPANSSARLAGTCRPVVTLVDAEPRVTKPREARGYDKLPDMPANRHDADNRDNRVVNSARGRQNATIGSNRLAVGERGRCSARRARPYCRPLDPIGAVTRTGNRGWSIQDDSRRRRTPRCGPRVARRSSACSNPTTPQGGPNPATVLTPSTTGPTGSQTQKHPLRRSGLGVRAGALEVIY
jgi:hypothetical protein